MYRQRLLEKDSDGEWFVNRVCELPAVSSAVGQMSALYSGVKQHNRLFRFTLDTAEGGIHKVYETARPVFSKFDGPIGTLNAMACQQLDKIERDFPAVTKPPEEVTKSVVVSGVTFEQKCFVNDAMKLLMETKKLCTTAVEPLINRVDAAKQYGIGKVTSVKTCASDKVTGMKEYGMNTLDSVSDIGRKQMALAFGTSVCHQSVGHLGTMLDAADRYVDTFLPENEDDASDKEKPPLVESDEECKPGTVMMKATRLSNKLRRRMFGRITSQLRSAQLRTKETVERFHFSVDLIEYSRAMVTSSKEKASYLWTEINKTEEEVAKDLTDVDSEARLPANSNFERRAVATARHLTQKSKRLMSSVGLPLDKLPEMVVQPVYDIVLYSVAHPADASAKLIAFIFREGQKPAF